MKKLLAYIFAIMLFTPYGLMLLGVDIVPNYSNEPVYAPLNGFRSSAEHYVNKKLGLRAFYISFNAWFHSLFGNTGRSDVLLGKNNMLFLGETLNSKSQADKIDDVAKYLQGINKALHNNGKEFYLLIVPNKASVYNQYLPKHAKPNTENTLLLLNKLDTMGIAYIYPLDELKASRELSYYKSDSHWNYKGAYIAYKQIMQKLNLSPIDVKFKQEYIYKGDLQAICFPALKPKLLDFIPNIPKQYTSRPIHSLNDITIKTKCKADTKSLLFIRDSFGEALFEYLANSFKELVFSRKYYDILQQAEYSNIVVLEIIERNLFTQALY